MTVSHPFSTRRGRKVRARFLDGQPLCEPCRQRGFVTAAVEVHHIAPISRGGAPLDPANFEARCGECHKLAHGAIIKGLCFGRNTERSRSPLEYAMTGGIERFYRKVSGNRAPATLFYPAGGFRLRIRDAAQKCRLS